MSHLPPPWCTAISHSVKGPPYTRGNVPRHHSIGQGSYLTSLAWGTVHLPYFGCLATPIRLIPNRVTQGRVAQRDRGSRVSRCLGDVHRLPQCDDKSPPKRALVGFQQRDRSRPPRGDTEKAGLRGPRIQLPRRRSRNRPG